MMRKIFLPLSLVLVFLLASCVGIAARESRAATHTEPDVKIAICWWPEMENVWTPVGWKDHRLRANVLYNGMVVIQPRWQPDKGRGVQIEFIPSADGVFPKPSKGYYRLADRYGPTGDQGWNSCATPVLWTRWNQNGLVLRKEIFGHVAGGGDVEKEVEPLYFWIRLSMQNATANVESGKFFWLVKINKPYLRRTMHRKDNLVALPNVKSAYPRGFRLEPTGPPDSADAWRLIQDDGAIRLGILAAAGVAVDLIDQRANGRDVYLRIATPVHNETHVDLLLPALPNDRRSFDAELARGRERALQEAERYWSREPATAAIVDTPEPMINETVRRNLQFVELLALRMPETGRYCQLSGSWHYERLWPTPTCMTHSMILDALGYHDVSEKYLEVYRDNQGKRRPPSKCYHAPPAGYFSAPKSMTSIDWLSDHGAILYAVCNHALVTGDKPFMDRWMNSIVKACEFIRDSIAMKGHGGVEGVLPPAVATDRRILVQAVWTDGWNYKGLAAAVRLMRRCGHPRAEGFAEVAESYKDGFTEAFRKAAAKTPQWTDSAGNRHHYVPTFLSTSEESKSKGQGRKKAVPFHEHPFYLDTGPMFLVYAGLMDADDPLMKESVAFFRTGPHVFDIDGDHGLPPSLHREMSSCEPCYSWDIFHSHALGERERFLEGMYSLFAGGMSRQTYISSETRGGISGTVFTAPLAIWLMRLAVLDDQLDLDELHLLRMVPLVWLRADRETRFERMPTQFGPVSLRFRLIDNARGLDVSFVPRFSHAPRRVVLHVPPLKTLRQVIVNGVKHSARPGSILPIQYRERDRGRD